jgi:hypothetical protein
MDKQSLHILAASRKLLGGALVDLFASAPSASSVVSPAQAAQAPSTSDVPAGTATTPTSVTVRFTVKVDDPVPPGTTGITRQVSCSEDTCQEPEPACTGSNPTPAPGRGW